MFNKAKQDPDRTKADHGPVGYLPKNPSRASARRVRNVTPRTRDIALIATFAALIAVCALLPSIAVAGIPTPITLQTFGVMLAALVLGAKRGSLAVVLYLAVGAAGLPVFSGGKAGLAVFMGPTVGYLLAFPIAAFFIGMVSERVLAALTMVETSTAKRIGRIAAATGTCLVISLFTIHALGALGMAVRVPMDLRSALLADSIFLPGDLIKTTCAVLVGAAILRAFPQLKTS